MAVSREGHIEDATKAPAPRVGLFATFKMDRTRGERLLAAITDSLARGVEAVSVIKKPSTRRDEPYSVIATE